MGEKAGGDPTCADLVVRGSSSSARKRVADTRTPIVTVATGESVGQRDYRTSVAQSPATNGQLYGGTGSEPTICCVENVSFELKAIAQFDFAWSARSRGDKISPCLREIRSWRSRNSKTPAPEGSCYRYMQTLSRYFRVRTRTESEFRDCGVTLALILSRSSMRSVFFFLARKSVLTMLEILWVAPSPAVTRNSWMPGGA